MITSVVAVLFFVNLMKMCLMVYCQLNEDVSDGMVCLVAVRTYDHEEVVLRWKSLLRVLLVLNRRPIGA